MSGTYNPYGMQMQQPYMGNAPMYANPQQPYMERLQSQLGQMQQQVQPNQQMAQSNTNFNWVRLNTVDEAQNVSVGAGNQVWMMLNNDTVFGVKTADNIGVCKTEWFSFNPLDITKKKETNETKDIDLSQYVPISEFNKLSSTVDDLNKKISSYEVMFSQQATKPTPTQNNSNNKRGGVANESSK